ncbi:MAG: S9 family peptidase, partial [Bacteroidia bacterium]
REIGKVTKKGKVSILSQGEGYHSARFDKDFTYFLDTYSNISTPPVYTVKDVKSGNSYVLENNQELKAKWEQMNLPRKEFIELPSAEKNVKLSAWRILPQNFDETKQYPVFITGYNGPNSQQVRNTFSVSWYDYLAQQGFIVYCVDTRGTAARGEAFRKATYMQLGKLESDDMIAAGKYLQTLPYINSKDLTIWGWSYGGFMSSLCLMKGQGVFSSAISVAPVMHWRFYDSVYTERYMRTPQENPDGYNLNSPLENVDKLKGNFNYLLVHGTADDNVHVQNTYALTKKLVAKDIPFKMHIYTDKNHGIYGGKTRLHLYKLFMNFLDNRTIAE